MRAFGKRMAVAVLVVGLAATAALAQDTDGDLHATAPKPKAFWEGWFSSTAKPAEIKPDKIDVPPAGPSAVEIAAATRKRELANYSRRMEVCDRLMEVAIGKSDEAMQAKIEQLKDRAWELYQERTGGLSASVAPTSDESVLQRKLGGDTTGRSLTAAPTEKAGAAGVQASVKREVKP